MGQAIGNEVKDIGRSIANEAAAQYHNVVPDKLPEWNWQKNGAHSNRRMSPRGVMDTVDKITQFLYPAFRGDSIPAFASGGIVDDAQFRPPAIAILVLGPRYFEGILKAAPVEYTLFDEDLTPIRATINIEFAAFEFADVTNIYNQKLSVV
jgi:hypothetical protein